MGAVGRGIGVALILGFGVVGCGSNDNDQGVSFRAVGIFQGERQQDQCQVPTTENAITDPSIALPLNSDLVDGGYPDSSSFLSFCRGFLQLENDLFDQAIVVDRFDFEYEIPGARIPIPANSSPTGLRINPANADPDANPNSFGQVNTIFVQLDGQLVPSSLVTFLRQNQPSLPTLPYVMIVHITARGHTDSGDLLVSNEARYTVEWTGQTGGLDGNGGGLVGGDGDDTEDDVGGDEGDGTGGDTEGDEGDSTGGDTEGDGGDSTEGV